MSIYNVVQTTSY